MKYKLDRLATDIAGGLLGTMPSAADFDDPVTRPYIEKYLAANSDYAVVDRIKLFRLIENLVAGAGAVGYLIGRQCSCGFGFITNILQGKDYRRNSL